MPFMMSLPGQDTPNPIDIVPVESGVELMRNPLSKRFHTLLPLHLPSEVAEGPTLSGEHAISPPGPGRDIDKIFDLEGGWNRKTIFDISMPLPQHLQIDRQHQGAAFGLRRTLDEGPRETTVLHDIKLEPERLFDGAGDVLYRADRQRR